MRRVTISLLLCMFIFYAPVSGIAGPMTAEDEVQLRQDLVDAGVTDAVIQVNVGFTVPREENDYFTVPDVQENETLWATVVRPNSPELLPTILIATGYTRIVSFLAALIAPHNYNVVIMDLRGTGASEGQWASLGLIEQYDVKYMIDRWIPSQDWNNGDVGLIGYSYLAIIGALAAGLVDEEPPWNPDDPATPRGEPTHLKAIVPISLLTDPYRGIAFQGGNMDIELYGSWIAATALLSALPPFAFLWGQEGFPATREEMDAAFDNWEYQVRQVPTYLGWLMDNDRALDGPYWDERSQMMHWPDKPTGVYVPDEEERVLNPNIAVLTGTGWFDVFTRDTTNFYQYGLKNHSDSDKAMIIGEWGHAGVTVGIGVRAMVLQDVYMRWFDWKIKGIEDPFMESFPVTLRVMGEDRWRAEKSWPLPESRVADRTLYLSKRSASSIDGDWFSDDRDSQLYAMKNNLSVFDLIGRDPVLEHSPLDLHGEETRSSQRWFYGGRMPVSAIAKFVFNNSIDDQVFWEDERDDDWEVLTFTTEPLEQDLEIVGPLLLKFWARTHFTNPLTQEAIDLLINRIKDRLNVEDNLPLDLMNEENVQWVVELDDVLPDGRARNLTSGWLSASHRQYDPNEPQGTVEHALDPGYTPFDPFYNRPDEQPIPINEEELYQYAIEILPTCNVFKAGHRIRLTISASDFPHFLPLLRPSSNEIVIDEDHSATLDYKTTDNSQGEGTTWKWLSTENQDPDETFSDYLLNHQDSP